MTMHVMERDYGDIVAARLAEMMGVAPATVAMTLKRMKRDQWITGTGRKAVHLTETGRAAAYSVIRRHMLTEWLLLDILKVPMESIHEEAHGIEHAISPQLEARMADILDNPQVCPHGNPFPGCEHVVNCWTPLLELPVGEPLVIRRIHEFAEDNPELFKFFLTHGVMPGAQVEITEILPFNQTLTLQRGEDTVTLGFHAAGYVFGEPAT